METSVKNSYEDAVLKCVQFWCDKCFNNNFNQDNGGNDPFSFMLLNSLSHKAQAAVTDEKIEKFQNKLIELLLNVKDRNRHNTELSVDYNPNEFLSEACKYAEISTLLLPIKSYTLINSENQAIGKFTYNGKQQIL